MLCSCASWGCTASRPSRASPSPATRDTGWGRWRGTSSSWQTAGRRATWECWKTAWWESILSLLPISETRRSAWKITHPGMKRGQECDNCVDEMMVWTHAEERWWVCKSLKETELGTQEVYGCEGEEEVMVGVWEFTLYRGCWGWWCRLTFQAALIEHTIT